jgi:hypothetical protein
MSSAYSVIILPVTPGDKGDRLIRRFIYNKGAACFDNALLLGNLEDFSTILL